MLQIVLLWNLSKWNVKTKCLINIKKHSTIKWNQCCWIALTDAQQKKEVHDRLNINEQSFQKMKWKNIQYLWVFTHSRWKLFCWTGLQLERGHHDSFVCVCLKQKPLKRHDNGDQIIKDKTVIKVCRTIQTQRIWCILHIKLSTDDCRWIQCLHIFCSISSTQS